jgi:hypothetical protein
MSSSTEDLRVELAYLRDTVVEAALQRKSSIVESGLETYEALVATFIDVLKEFGSPYDRDQALAEIHSVGGGWSEIEWVRDDYREIADAALASENLSVILPVIYFPVRVSGLAYEQREYFIFAQFLNWLSYLYGQAVEQLVKDEDGAIPQRGRASLFEIVRDRLSSYPYEVAAYRISRDLSESNDPKEIRQSFDFAREVFANFNRLLKSAYDFRRPRDFQQFASDFQDIYRHEHDYLTRVAALDPDKASEDPENAPPDVVRSSCHQELARLRQIIFLGLDAWLLRDYSRDNLTFSDASAFRGSLYIPSGLAELWSLYLEVRSERYERELDWTWWESNEHRGRAAYAGIDFSALVLRSVLLRMLGTASSMTREQIAHQPLTLTRDLDYLVGDGSGLIMETLKNLGESADLRELAPFDPSAVDSLRDRFLALAEEQAEGERVRVIEAPLFLERVDALKSNVMKGWHEGGFLRRVVARLGNYEVEGSPPGDLGVLSIHLWERKDIFVEESRFSTHGWGTEWGQSLARGEDELVVGQIASAVPSLSNEPVDPTSAVSFLDRALRAEASMDSPVIMLVGSLAASWALAESNRFQYARHISNDEDRPRPTATFDDVPIYQIHTDKEPLAIVADLKKLGVWRQYKPRTRGHGELLDGVMYFELESFNETEAEAFLAERQPDAFRYDDGESVSGRERTTEERIALLRQRVRILILEQLEFHVTNPESGRVIRFTE